MGDYRIERVGAGAALADAHAVRRAVFIEEQGVPESIEMDDKDVDAIHLVAYDESDPIGTARLREAEPETGKVERVAVLASHRDAGCGRALMADLEAVAVAQGFEELILHAQTSVESFYQELGYETVSDTFLEAGIPHVEMTKSLTGNRESV